MATGDQNDMMNRLKALMPRGWFNDVTPVLDAVLTGAGNSLAWIFGQETYTALQTRIATATDIFLNLVSFDYFGTNLPRHPGESDAAYSARIRQQLLLPRGTRPALSNAVELLTGQTPVIIEPWNPQDCGSYSHQGGPYAPNYAYSTVGYYGSYDLPFQLFIQAFRPSGEGVALVGGYYTHSGWAGGGYGTGAIEYVGTDMISAQVTDAEIYATIAETMPAATTAWTSLSGPTG